MCINTFKYLPTTLNWDDPDSNCSVDSILMNLSGQYIFILGKIMCVLSMDVWGNTDVLCEELIQ